MFCNNFHLIFSLFCLQFDYKEIFDFLNVLQTFDIMNKYLKLKINIALLSIIIKHWFKDEQNMEEILCFILFCHCLK